jgi:hypothetical protein
VEFLWWEGCPSWPGALEMLREAMEVTGLDPDSIELREIETDSDAQRASFPGSPTIRIDGEDVQPPGDNPIGLSCRVYRRPDGRPSPLPDRGVLEGALRGASD